MSSFSALRTVAAGVLLASVPLAAWAQTQVPEDLTTIPPLSDEYRPSTTPWGDPDFTGTWPLNDIAELPVERPARYGDRLWKTPEELAAEAGRTEQLETAYDVEDEEGTIGIGHWIEYQGGSRRTSMLVSPADGQLPEFTEEGIRRTALGRSSYTPGQTYDWVTDFDSWDRCISRGLPASMFPFRYNNGIRIFQSPGYVTIALEMLGTRVIPISGEAEAWPQPVKAWLGNSRGRWEDHNTLVVETSNIQSGAAPFNAATRGVPRSNVVPMSEQAKVTERFHMIGPDTITYEMTYEDSVIFSGPFTTRVDWSRDETYEFYEYACHEGNVQVRNYITANRAAREAEYARGRMFEPLAWQAPRPPMDPAAAGRARSNANSGSNNDTGNNDTGSNETGSDNETGSNNETGSSSN